MKAANDKYYTPHSIIDQCVGVMRKAIPTAKVIMEPCAGDGRWSRRLGAAYPDAEVKMYDLIPDPGCDHVSQMDFLKEIADISPDVVVTNPPFGKANSMSHRIFNRAADVYKPEYICFLVPRSFGKKLDSLRSLSLDYSLLVSEPLSNSHFERPDGHEYEGTESTLCCAFQVWKRQPRKAIPPFQMIKQTLPNGKPLWSKESEHGFTIYRPSTNKGVHADGRSKEESVGIAWQHNDPNMFTITTHGTLAGTFKDYDPVKDKVSVRQFISASPEVRELIEQCDFSEFTDASAFKHNPSLNSEEIFYCIEKMLAKRNSEE